MYDDGTCSMKDSSVNSREHFFDERDAVYNYNINTFQMGFFSQQKCSGMHDKDFWHVQMLKSNGLLFHSFGQ